MAQNRNHFRITRFLLLQLPKFFRLLAKFRRPRKRLLIIKADAIGDYILFRNFIAEVSKAAKYRGYEIDLLANTVCGELAMHYDSELIARFFFIRPYQWLYQPRDVLKLGWQLFTRRYEVVFNPSSTRLLITDGFAGLTAANDIIGYESDTEGIEARYKKHTDHFYSQLLGLPPAVYHEFHRNKYFFAAVLNLSADVQAPALPIQPANRTGILIVPGAGIAKRGWEAEKFVAIIRMILKETSENIIIAGGPGDVDMNARLVDEVASDRVQDLTNTTTLPQLVNLIASAKLVIANDSGAVHMAVATGIPSVAITGGGHFDRFVPYPAGFPNAPVCVYHKLDCYYCNWNCIYQTVGNERYPCVSLVTVDGVWHAVKSQLGLA